MLSKNFRTRHSCTLDKISLCHVVYIKQRLEWTGVLKTPSEELSITTPVFFHFFMGYAYFVTLRQRGNVFLLRLIQYTYCICDTDTDTECRYMGLSALSKVWTEWQETEICALDSWHDMWVYKGPWAVHLTADMTCEYLRAPELCTWQLTWHVSIWGHLSCIPDSWHDMWVSEGPWAVYLTADMTCEYLRAPELLHSHWRPLEVRTASASSLWERQQANWFPLQMLQVL